jgi:hypothetical protein
VGVPRAWMRLKRARLWSIVVMMVVLDAGRRPNK